MQFEHKWMPRTWAILFASLMLVGCADSSGSNSSDSVEDPSDELVEPGQEKENDTEPEQKPEQRIETRIVCNAETCRATCCGDVCRDTTANPDHCGACDHKCKDNEACVNSQCMAVGMGDTDECPVGQFLCHEECTIISQDPNNCGACDHACRGSERCENGQCVNTCVAANEVICDGECIDLSSNPDQCGGCYTTCSQFERCVNGVCTEECLKTGEKVCQHECIDTLSDKNNCGACNHVCGEKEMCVEGECKCPEEDPYCNIELPTCVGEEKLCGIECVLTSSNVNHCGECDHVCEGASDLCIDSECQDCSGKTVCEDGRCYDLMNDPNNCGTCGNACGAHITCVDGQCATCEADWIDCDGDTTNGCEKTTADCACINGETQSCYYGPAGTEGVGACKAGVMTCQDNAWSDCIGMVLPNYVAACHNKEVGGMKDQNCDGIVDGTEDYDHDGVTICGGDCCDTNLQPGCESISKPELVRPGMVETLGNKIDDNCNGRVDEAPTTTCTASYTFGTDLSIATNRNNAGQQLARAMDICTTSANDGYGLVSATVKSLNASTLGTAAMGKAINVFNYLASKSAPTTPLISPKKGSTFAGISTGVFEKGNLSNGAEFLAEGSVPADYLSANGGSLVTFKGCASAATDASGKPKINDSLNLHLQLKAPVNATGFSFEFRFYSHEYPGYICSAYNDFFIALLNSKAAGLPADKNIVKDKNGNPVSINNAFFTTCAPVKCNWFTSIFGACAKPYTKGCEDKKCMTEYGACPDGTAGLDGFGEGGGATAWLKTQAPVVGGETFTLDFYIWDTSDSILDSAAIIDNFTWITTTGTVKVSTDFSERN